MVLSSDTSASHLVLRPDLHCFWLDGLRVWGCTSHLSFSHHSYLGEVEMRSVNNLCYRGLCNYFVCFFETGSFYYVECKFCQGSSSVGLGLS